MEDMKHKRLAFEELTAALEQIEQDAFDGYRVAVKYSFIHGSSHPAAMHNDLGRAEVHKGVLLKLGWTEGEVHALYDIAEAEGQEAKRLQEIPDDAIEGCHHGQDPDECGQCDEGG